MLQDIGFQPVNTLESSRVVNTHTHNTNDQQIVSKTSWVIFGDSGAGRSRSDTDLESLSKECLGITGKATVLHKTLHKYAPR